MASRYIMDHDHGMLRRADGMLVGLGEEISIGGGYVSAQASRNCWASTNYHPSSPSARLPERQRFTSTPELGEIWVIADRRFARVGSPTPRSPP